MDGLDELRSQLLRLEAEVAYLRGRLTEAAEDAAGAAEAGSFRIEDAPAGPPTETDDEIEVDSRVLDGSTPSGGSTRREDKSLEWAAGEIAVLRLFAWADNTLRTKTIGPEESSSSSGSSSDGIRFLARVPKNPKDPSKGAKLGYFKLYAEGGCPPAYSLKEESASCGSKVTLMRKACDESGSGSSAGSFALPPVPSMSIGNVSSGSSASASIRDGSRCGSFLLDLVLPKGDPGTPGKDGPDAMRFDPTSGEIQYHYDGAWYKLMDTTDCS